MQTAPSLRRDIASAYLVTAARVAAWIVVTAAVFRVAGKPAFALLAIIQSTVGILEYAAIGLSPAIISLTAEAIRDARNGSGSESISSALTVYANGFFMALLTAIGGAVFLAGFIRFFNSSQMNIHSGGVASELVLMVGIATLLRLLSDAPAAALQTSGKIFLDNLLLTSHEVIWGLGTAVNVFLFHLPWQRATGFALLAGSLILLLARAIMSHRHGSGLFDQWWRRFNAPMVRRLLIFGGTVVAAQMADYLYAPTDNLLILNLIDQATVAVYTPAVQIDGGALLLAGRWRPCSCRERRSPTLRAIRSSSANITSAARLPRSFFCWRPPRCSGWRRHFSFASGSETAWTPPAQFSRSCSSTQSSAAAAPWAVRFCWPSERCGHSPCPC